MGSYDCTLSSDPSLNIEGLESVVTAHYGPHFAILLIASPESLLAHPTGRRPSIPALTQKDGHGTSKASWVQT
jgi:hypothetical protein